VGSRGVSGHPSLSHFLATFANCREEEEEGEEDEREGSGGWEDRGAPREFGAEGVREAEDTESSSESSVRSNEKWNGPGMGVRQGCLLAKRQLE
jgi:hypothetical protein